MVVRNGESAPFKIYAFHGFAFPGCCGHIPNLCKDDSVKWKCNWALESANGNGTGNEEIGI